EHIYLQKYLGRIRDVCVAPNGDIYLCTSNHDWHPRYQPWMYEGDSLPHSQDDRIIRLSRATAPMLAQIEKRAIQNPLKEDMVAAEMPSEDWARPVGQVSADQGASLYARHCAGCHRPDGKGAEGMIPPLVATEWVTGSKDRLIYAVLNGLSEPIEVNGVNYDQEMPGFATLSDEEVAAILSYIRQSFGNQAGIVTSAEILEERRILSQQ
ncbi:MAG: c-type cytochrome, partial [Bacteroidia bacterium]|nr:c-type cytochrome [Bacteroidia bacterium]